MKEETMRICLIWLATHIALRASAAARATPPAGSKALVNRQKEVALALSAV